MLYAARPPCSLIVFEKAQQLTLSGVCSQFTRVNGSRYVAVQTHLAFDLSDTCFCFPGADSNNKAFHATDINALMARTPMEIPRDTLYFDDSSNTNHIMIAVDPAGGGASAFAVCSMVQQPSGSIVVSASRGQLPSLSPPNNSLSSTARNTYDSGAWQLCCRKAGSMNGRTRSTKSLVSSGSALSKCLLSSGSLWSANRRRARLQQIPCSLAAMLATSPTSLPASRVASLAVPYTRAITSLIPCTCCVKTASVSSTDGRVPVNGGPNSISRSVPPPPSQILGIDALRTKDVRLTHKAVIAHCQKVRTIKNLENATLVFSFESNLAYEAQVSCDVPINRKSVPELLTNAIVCNLTAHRARHPGGGTSQMVLYDRGGREYAWLADGMFARALLEALHNH